MKTTKTGSQQAERDSWYGHLFRNVGPIKEAGFSVVYLPPPWRDRSIWRNADSYGGGEGYYWSDATLESLYGSEKELKRLTTELSRNDISTIVDMVPGHRDHERMRSSRWPYPGKHWRIHKSSLRPYGYPGDLDIETPEVFDYLLRAMKHLIIDVGVSGFRWDRVYDYHPDIVNSWKSEIRREARNEIKSLGEYWPVDFENGRHDLDPLSEVLGKSTGKRIIEWALYTNSSVLDVFLKKCFQSASFNNLKSTLIFHQDANVRCRAVSFVDNHDTGYSPDCQLGSRGQAHWPCADQFKPLAYALALLSPGVPCVYWADYFDFGYRSLIRELVSIRKRCGIHSSSFWTDVYANGIRFSGNITGNLSKSVNLHIGCLDNPVKTTSAAMYYKPHPLVHINIFD